MSNDMVTDDKMSLDLSLAFPRAGVVFAIQVRKYSGDPGRSPASFRLSVLAASDGRPVLLRPEASPQLADWVRGYTRWLVRANVRASYDKNGVVGVITGGLTAEEVLQGVQDACDMIRQRFGPYQESVLV